MENSTTIGPNQYSSCSNGVSIFFTTAMAIISSAAFIGNILVIVSVYKTPRLRTSTNYYYVNMAISDFLASVITWPLYLTDEFIISPGSQLQGPLATVACKVGSYFRIVSQIVSILSLVLIAVDRFIATVFPLKATLITRKVRTTLLFGTWLISLAPSILIFHYLTESQIGHETFCTLSWNSLGMTSAVVIYNFVPLIAIIVIYSRITQVLRRRTKPDYTARGNALPHKRNEQNQNVMNIFKSIVAAYFICFLPYGIYAILDYALDSFHPVGKCSFIRGFCYYIFPSLSAAINPIILFAFSTNFRHVLQSLCPFSLGNCRSCCPIAVHREDISLPQLMPTRRYEIEVTLKERNNPNSSLNDKSRKRMQKHAV